MGADWKMTAAWGSGTGLTAFCARAEPVFHREGILFAR